MDNLDNIRIMLMYERIRGINSMMSEEMFQALKALSKEEWIDQWLKAGLNATREDLGIVHDKLWPKGE